MEAVTFQTILMVLRKLDLYFPCSSFSIVVRLKLLVIIMFITQ